MTTQPDAKTPLVAIVGPTASGKTRVAVELALRTGAEVVSADSMQLYRGMDIGTAKPGLEERRGIPHHLIDVADPDDPFDARRYALAADEAIAAIRSRGRPVVLVGGTGLYVRALLRGLAPAPGADQELRTRLRALASTEGRAAVHRLVAQVDPQAAARISPNDLVRMERALEAAASGRALSSLQRDHGFSTPRYDAMLIALDVPSPALADRIEARARRMFEAGFVDEVARLVGRYGAGLGTLRAVGYRQIVEGGSLEEVARATRRYAKRQRTWFRSEPKTEWHHPEDLPWNRMLSHLFKLNGMG
ncbi:MAG: tRNA (adenosine(37)-N6)-dimethylallyltransferase MiaA [Deltaproteobacteria bacterium]|nr:tRNA (adenosine(37)-N6)-dimethylallyltransferase MiaA [Deltaproteobacteria bacterium]